MPKAFSEIEPSAVHTAGAAALFSGIPFEHCDFNTAQLQLIFSCGKTTLFGEILPQLEELGGVYYEGGRVKATGAAILTLRARKLKRPRGKKDTRSLTEASLRKRAQQKAQAEGDAAAKARRTEDRP
jgi:hypothetical protein